MKPQEYWIIKSAKGVFYPWTLRVWRNDAISVLIENYSTNWECRREHGDRAVKVTIVEVPKC